MTQNTVQPQVEVFWFVTPRSVVVGCQRFGGPCCHHLHVAILPQHYTSSRPRRPRLQSSPPQKPQIFHRTYVCVCVCF